MWRRVQKISTRRRLGRARLSCQMLASVPSAPLSKRTVAVATSSIPSWPWKLVVWALTRVDLADEEAQHVDVVDAVLEQRAGPGEGAVAPPRRAVVALDRDELVVAEDDAHHRAGGRRRR